ncbi:MAG: pilus assembly protein TadC [Gammaproteobacteria bacterium]|jgi:pilus assembly protein TadC
MKYLELDIDTISHVVSISVAPVFLLAGISGLLMVLTNRLARTIDRSRSLHKTLTDQTQPQFKVAIEKEMAKLVKRSRFINLAINLAAVSALMVCFVIITLFVGSLSTYNVALVVAGLFIFCMTLLSASFSCFLVEVFIATRTLRSTLNSIERFKE